VSDMNRKVIYSSSVLFVVLLFAAPLLRSQDLSKYRHFTLGMTLAKVLERTEQKLVDVKTIHSHPAEIQELTWWPPALPGLSSQADSVEQIVFSFYNSELYKISVTYDRASTEGLTADDMIKSISAKYGPPTSVVPKTNPANDNAYPLRQEIVASWADDQYSFNLVRSSFTDRLGLTIYSKRVTAEAERATADAVKLEDQEGPQREAERQKRKMDDLETERQKNRKIFRP
jgi:hypothetical protein